MTPKNKHHGDLFLVFRGQQTFVLRLRTYIAQQLLAKSVCTFRNTLQRSKSMKEIITELRIQTFAHADAFCSPQDELTVLLNLISQTRDQKVMIGEGMNKHTSSRILSSFLLLRSISFALTLTTSFPPTRRTSKQNVKTLPKSGE